MTVSWPEPIDQWIPSKTLIYDTANALLTIVGSTLDTFGYGESYPRRSVTHGTESVIIPNDVGQITVCCGLVFMGKAGQQLYQFVDGSYGKEGFHVMQFSVEITNPWPKPVGGAGPRLPSVDELQSAAQPLMRDGMILWATMQAFAMGGVTIDPPALLVQQDQVHVGPLQAMNPQGGSAAWKIQMEIQF